MSFSNPNVWTSTHPTLQDGLVYAVRTRATDLAGNVEPLKAPLTFTFDVSSPTARITQPSSGSQLSSLPYISGTVFDNTGLPGVQTVELAIQVDTGTWYSNVSGTFDQNSEYFFTAASTNNFTTWFATGIPFVDGHVYGIKARATDKATNVQMVFATNISTLTFTFDNVPPVTVIQVPVGEPSVPRVNSLPIISGTAADTLNTSLNLVQLRIRRDDLVQYYDPTGSRDNPSFSISETNSNTAWFTADTANAYVNWSATFTWKDGFRYMVQSRAIDKAGNISAIVSSTFTYDTSAPTSFVSLPSSAVIAGLVMISGTASDGGTVTNLETAIENLNTGQWFDGSGFTGSGVLWQPKSTLTGAGPFTWTYTVLHNSALQTGTSYYVISRAYDDSGNIESNTAPGSETFTYDINVPTATLQVPANNLYYKAGQVTTLSGTAADTVSVVKTLQLYIQRNSDGQYWQDLESPADGFGVWGTTVSAINVSTSSLPNWSYTLGNEPEIWSHNAAYKVWIAATDLPGNAQTSYAVGTSSNGFTYDTQFATSAVVVPVNADYYNASTKPLPVISGTAVDETLGNRVQSVGYSIKENVSGNYWNVLSSTFNSGSELFNALSFSNPNVWTSTHPTLQDGLVYAVRTRATDLAGNVEPLKAPLTFTFDVSSPTARITQPSSGSQLSSLPYISGTVFDNTGLPGVQTVELAIQVDTGTWYSNVSGTFDQNSEYFFTAASTNNFTTWFSSNIPFVSGHTYSIKSRATDKATNVQTIFATGVSTVSFVFDNTKPASGVTFPDGTQVLSVINQVQGTASDNYAGVRNVYVSVGQVLSNGVTNYYNGAAFTAATEYFNLATWNGTSPWTYSASIPYTSGLRYLFHSYAIDVASNTETSLAPVIAAYYDVTKPTASLTSPVQATYRSELNSIQGNAYDRTAGLAALGSGGVQVRIQQVGGNYWGGTSFNQTDGNAAWTNANAGTPSNWSYNDGTLSSLLVSSVTYLVQVRATDQAVPANQGPSSDGTNSNFTQGVDSVTVVVDMIAPVSRLLSPAPGATTYLNTLPTISGTSMDTISGITSAGQVTVSIREANPAGAWWSGASTFTAGSEQFNSVTALSAPNSIWTLTSPTFKHGTAYLVRVRASDNVVPVPNVESVNLSSAVFVYDIQYPTATVVFPSNGSIVSSLNNISGTSFDEFVTSAVYVTMRDDSGLLWWDLGTSTFSRTSGTKIFYVATPASPGVWTTWTWPFDSTKLTTGHSYTLNIYAVDAAGNIQPVSASGFTWDKTDPVSFVTVPTDGSFVGLGHFTTISGTADDANDIQGVQLSIQRLSDNDWWDTTTNNWNPVGPLYIGTGATIDGPSGSHPRGFHLNSALPPDNKLTADVQYRVKAQATDVPGNVQQTLDAGVVFRYDISAPQVAIQYPQNNQLYPSIVVLSGTAQDNFNTKRVELRLKDGNGEYWDGGNFVISPNTWVIAVGSSATSGVVNWTYSTLPAWPNQTFELDARGLDEGWKLQHSICHKYVYI